MKKFFAGSFISRRTMLSLNGIIKADTHPERGKRLNGLLAFEQGSSSAKLRVEGILHQETYRQVKGESDSRCQKTCLIDKMIVQ
jgi:hypothetical protein